MKVCEGMGGSFCTRSMSPVDGNAPILNGIVDGAGRNRALLINPFNYCFEEFHSAFSSLSLADDGDDNDNIKHTGNGVNISLEEDSEVSDAETNYDDGENSRHNLRTRLFIIVIHAVVAHVVGIKLMRRAHAVMRMRS